jgi:WD40 repeat protein
VAACPRSLVFLTGLAIVLGHAVLGAPLPATGAEPPNAQPGGRTDRYGDPLPAGAVARLGTVRLRCGGEVDSVAISPDGKLVAAAATLGSVRVWDTETAQEVDRFKDKIRADEVGFSPDGKVLLAAQGSGGLQHWDVATGTLLRQSLPVERGHFFFQVIGFSQDRKFLAVIDRDSRALLVETATGKPLVRLDKDPGLFSVAVSGDGKTLATGNTDKVVRIWDTATAKVLHELKGMNSLCSPSPSPRTAKSWPRQQETTSGSGT